MKKKMMIWLAAGGLAWPAMAGDPATSPSAQTKLPFKTVFPLLHLFHPKSAPDDKIDRLGSISSRPWDRVAGEVPAPLFEDQREYVGQPNFNLLWIGKTPR